jgi:hypothetical protein
VKKKKFSIKKFLRMGNGKTENHHSSKKDYSHYADIPSSPSDDSITAPQVKPRLIIIHPLDINNTGVEVVSSNNSPSSPSNDKFVSHKPPVPPVRSDTTKLETNKPSRPPPPKNSNELKHEIESQKSKAPSPPPNNNNVDSVYANLGEIRNSITPRKPERTNSMREREAKLALELKRRQQPVGENSLSERDIGEESEAYKNEEIVIAKPNSIKPSISTNSSSAPIVTECKKKVIEIENVSTRSKIELFENNAKASSKSPSPTKQQIFLNNDGLKSSVQKMNITIDNYLRNKKMSASDSNLLESRSPTPPQIVANEIAPSPPSNNRSHSTSIEVRSNASYEPININVNGSKYQRASYPDNNGMSPVLAFGKIYIFII